MDNVRFGNLTPGYCGLKVETSTLNSRFLGHVKQSCLSIRMPFPNTQRLPRLGFFAEIEACETTTAQSLMADYKQSVTNELIEISNSANDGPLSHRDGQLALALIGLLRRLGSQKAFSLRFESVDQNISTELAEFDLSLNVSLSNSEAPRFQKLEDIFRRYMNSDLASVSAKSRICVRAIATISRHGRSLYPTTTPLLDEASSFLKAMLTSYSPNSFSESITYAMALRALPMKSEFSPAQKLELVLRSIEFIENIKAESELEHIVRSELLYTTQLTFIKTSAESSSESEVEMEFQKLISLDPYDSTGYGELAMFWSRNGESEKAIEAFKKAIEYGPPAFAMNFYFLGKLQKEKGLLDDAIASWEACSAIDATAISPVIDRIATFIDLGNLAEARRLKADLLKSEDLNSQIATEDEDVLSRI